MSKIPEIASSGRKTRFNEIIEIGEQLGWASSKAKVWFKYSRRYFFIFHFLTIMIKDVCSNTSKFKKWVQKHLEQNPTHASVMDKLPEFYPENLENEDLYEETINLSNALSDSTLDESSNSLSGQWGHWIIVFRFHIIK